MKNLLTLVALCFSFAVYGQHDHDHDHDHDHAEEVETVTVEASCGQCNFGLEGKGCSLAIRFDGEAYYVDGSSIEDHGDAHAADGMCNAIRTAEVAGEVVDGRFQATYFAVVEDEDK